MLFTDVPPTESTSYQGVCPEETNVEYHQSYSWLPFKGYCYLFVTEEIEWADAASSCVRHGKGHCIHRKLHSSTLDCVDDMYVCMYGV